MKRWLKMSGALSQTLVSVLIMLLIMAVVGWQLWLVGSVDEGASLSYVLPPSLVTVTLAPTLPSTITPNPTQVAGVNLLATKEAEMTLIQQTAEAAATITPDPTQVFLWLHPTRTIWPTPDLAISYTILGGTPAGAGMITKIIPPFYTREYGVNNSWYEILSGQAQETLLYVHAGFVPTPTDSATQQGLVTLQILKRNPATKQFDLTSLAQFPTPAQAGPVQVVDAVGEQLILQSTSGATFYFDVPARQFRPSLVATVTAVPPTGTPMPPSPLATPAP